MYSSVENSLISDYTEIGVKRNGQGFLSDECMHPLSLRVLPFSFK